jgi:hypothetical protein
MDASLVPFLEWQEQGYTAQIDQWAAHVCAETQQVFDTHRVPSITWRTKSPGSQGSGSSPLNGSFQPLVTSAAEWYGSLFKVVLPE